MKKKVYFLFFLALTCSVVFASGAKEGPGKPVTLTIAGRDGAYGDSLQLAADAYTAIHPEVKFEIQKLSGSSLYEKTVIDMKSKLGTYDLVLIDDPNAPQYQKAGWLANLDDLYKAKKMSVDADFIGPALKLGRYPYKDSAPLYSLPFAGNVELFAYRTDLFAKYGLKEPKLWTDVLEAAKTISMKEKGVSGVIFRGSKGNPIVTGFLPIFWAFGGKILDENDNVVVNSPAGLNALKYFLELAKFAPEGVSMYQSAQVRDAIYSGTGAIAIEVWPGWIGDLENPEKSTVVGKVKITKHPGQVEKSSSMIGIWLAAIPEASKQKTAAFDFLQFLTGYKMQLEMSTAYGLPPTRKSVYEVAALSAKYPWYPAQLDALNNGVARTRSLKWKEIEDQLGSVLQLALLGNLSAEEALRNAETGIKAALQQHSHEEGPRALPRVFAVTIGKG